MIPPGGWLQQLRFKLCWFHHFIRSKMESPPGFLVQVFWPDKGLKKNWGHQNLMESDEGHVIY